MSIIDRDPPARRLALVHWSAELSKWVVVVAGRVPPATRSQLMRRAFELPGHCQVLEVTGNSDSVAAVVAALAPPDGGALRQLPLFDDGDRHG